MTRFEMLLGGGIEKMLRMNKVLATKSAREIRLDSDLAAMSPFLNFVVNLWEIHSTTED